MDRGGRKNAHVDGPRTEKFFLLQQQSIERMKENTTAHSHLSFSQSTFKLLVLLLFTFVNCHSFVITTGIHKSRKSTTPPSERKSVTENGVVDIVSPIHEEGSTTTTTPSVITCQFCQATFPSRNALFRHLKSSPECSIKANMMLVDDKYQRISSIALAIQFSYGTDNDILPPLSLSLEEEEESTSMTTPKKTEAVIAGEKLQKALLAGVQEYVSDDLNGGGERGGKPTVVDTDVSTLGSASQGSLARLRHIALDQEVGCGAVGDTMVIRIQGPNLRFTDEDHQRVFLERLLESTNRILKRMKDDEDISPIITVQVEACKLLSLRDGKLLHCEQMCTQRVYHYLLPLRWLPDGDKLERWWIETSVGEDENGNTNKSYVRPPSDALRKMKQFLRSAEAERLNRNGMDENEEEEENDNGNTRSSIGRFGSLGDKKRIPWHNFADPNLQGNASPNTKPVWRVLDRARFQLLLSRNRYGDDEKEVIAVLEFRGDDFLPQQIRRIVGTTLAMTHGWLPESTLDVATRSDCFVETVLAPAGRLYLVENRFHWDEMRTAGKSIFESNVDGVAVQRSVTTNQDTAMNSIQNRILTRCDNELTRSQERLWLTQLEQSICPRIKSSVEEWEQSLTMVETQNGGEVFNDLDPEPMEYRRTLDLLRKIIIEDQWPETSIARSSVIGNLNRDPSTSVHKKGSFTVINPQFRNGLYKAGVGNDPLPLGNELFPDLVQAVFDLEELIVRNAETIQDGTDLEDNLRGGLTKKNMRVSSHCAINCNAQFTPHVDSGRGAGQSLSMIVGLGDYKGGELGVEGIFHTIRYHPLEFDGWRLRHWTKPFSGERFSLVWFTPELKGDEGSISR